MYTYIYIYEYIHLNHTPVDMNQLLTLLTTLDYPRKQGSTTIKIKPSFNRQQCFSAYKIYPSSNWLKRMLPLSIEWKLDKKERKLIVYKMHKWTTTYNYQPLPRIRIRTKTVKEVMMKPSRENLQIKKNPICHSYIDQMLSRTNYGWGRGGRGGG